MYRNRIFFSCGWISYVDVINCTYFPLRLRDREYQRPDLTLTLDHSQGSTQQLPHDEVYEEIKRPFKGALDNVIRVPVRVGLDWHERLLNAKFYSVTDCWIRKVFIWRVL